LFHGVLALALAALGTAAVLGAFRPSPLLWYHLLGAWLVAVNLVAFGYYGYDKSCARASSRRVPEVVLHGLALAGGSVGAYVGMRFYRHKTVKGPFRVVFWFVVACQLAIVAAVAYRVWKHSRGG
jgi:uncharacterized membrane protein YsdA (DUF1294 family)